MGKNSNSSSSNHQNSTLKRMFTISSHWEDKVCAFMYKL